MENKITLELINSFDPCYNPKNIGFTGELSLTPLELIDQFRDKVESKADILWLLCRKEFMSDRDMRLFAVWCAREALKLIEQPDERSLNACDIAEKYANGEATQKELDTARAAAAAAACATARAAAAAAACTTARAAAAAAAAADAAADAAAYSAAATAAATAAAVSASYAYYAADRAARAAWAAVRDAQINKLREYFQ